MELIEKDNVTRRSLGRAMPSLEQLDAMRNLVMPKGPALQQMLWALGIVPMARTTVLPSDLGAAAGKVEQFL